MMIRLSNPIDAFYGNSMDTIETLSVTLGAAWASGINLYATVFTLGLLGATGHITLPQGLEILSDPLVLAAAGFMYLIEFFADKTPGVDSGWDAIHTFIRIPAGAILAAGTAQGLDVGPAAELAALLIGGTLAAGSHFTKAGTRLMINSSPEPFSNWGASILEDIAVFAGLWAAIYNPWLFLSLLALFVLLVAWLLPKLWRNLRNFSRRLGNWFGRQGTEPPPQPASTNRQESLKRLYNDSNK